MAEINALDGLQIISGCELTRYYSDNIQTIYQLEASHIISTLANKKKEHLHALRSNLINKIQAIFPAFKGKRTRKCNMVENICKDIHTLTTCIVKKEDIGLANMFVSKRSQLNEDLSTTTTEDLPNTIPEDLSNNTTVLDLTNTAQPLDHCPADISKTYN